MLVKRTREDEMLPGHTVLFVVRSSWDFTDIGLKLASHSQTSNRLQNVISLYGHLQFLCGNSGW